jgi:hypothetical protein
VVCCCRYTERGDPARLPAKVAGRLGTNKVEKCTVRKIIFCTGLTRAAKAGKKSIVPARRVQQTNQGRTPINCQVPIHLSFNSQQGPPLSSLSGCSSPSPPPLPPNFPTDSRAAIQRRGSILAWIVILSVYGTDRIAEVKLLISPFLRADLLFYEINNWLVFETILIYMQ